MSCHLQNCTVEAVRTNPKCIFHIDTNLKDVSNEEFRSKLLHFIEAKDHARIMANATGIKITDDGVVYVTSESKGTLLKIVDGEIEATSLIPDVFKDSDLGGVECGGTL